MENIIIQYYTKAKNENKEADGGIGNYAGKRKVESIICLIILGICGISSIVFIMCKPNILDTLCPLFFILVMLVLQIPLMRIHTSYRMEHLGAYKVRCWKQIELLNKVLVVSFGIDNDDKIRHLIKLYESCYAEKKKDEDKRNKMIYGIFSALTSILSASFFNMKKIGLDFSSWLLVAVLVGICFTMMVAFVYGLNLFDKQKENYKMMVKDLNELLLLKGCFKTMKTLSDYMKINYRMKIVEDAEEGGFVVSFPELSGCLTCGDTKEKAIANAIDAKRAWFEAALEAGMEINIPSVPNKDI